MTLGTKRRSNGRLVDSSSLSPSPDRANLSPQTPPHHHRKKVKFPLTFNDKLQKSSLRRIPFLVWVASISTYCCIMLLHAGVYRNMRQPTSINHQKPTRSIKRPKILRKSNADIKHANQPILKTTTTTGYEINPELVHVVETRFMQEQYSLLELGLARLALFESFCLPSMLTQSNGNFLWIIRADPKLHPSIVKRMQELLKGKPNFILMGSNKNPEGFGRDNSTFTSFLQADSKTDGAIAPVWSGNITLVEEAYKDAAAGAILLETRLDSDDALHSHFIETVQTDARKNLVSDTIDQNDIWRLWCIDSRIEFHPFSPYPQVPEIVESNETFPEGYLVLFSEKVCVTPGLTFGYGGGASRDSMGVGRLRHDQISKKINKCKQNNTDIQVKCVSRVTKLLPGALRARTTTSAGMQNVITGNEDIDKGSGFLRPVIAKNKNFIRQYFHQQELWDSLSNDFSVTRQDAKEARDIIVNRMQEIAEDNLKGQCTSGHSCKNGTQKVLEILKETEKVAAE